MAVCSAPMRFQAARELDLLYHATIITWFRSKIRDLQRPIHICPQGNFLPACLPLSYSIQPSHNENESGTCAGVRRLKAAIRLTTGCESACQICTVRCASMVAIRDDLWREVEELHRLQAMLPTLDRAREVRTLQSQLEAAERECRRLRPSIPCRALASQSYLH